MLLMLFKSTGEAPPTPAPVTITRYACNESITGVSANCSEGLTTAFSASCSDGEGT